jgi:hypothetical protein
MSDERRAAAEEFRRIGQQKVPTDPVAKAALLEQYARAWCGMHGVGYQSHHVGDDGVLQVVCVGYQPVQQIDVTFRID